MRPRSEKVANFCARWDSSVPEVAISRAVYASFPELRKMSPPIDLFAIARSRDIRIVAADMEYDGILSRSKAGSYLIELNSERRETRKRFTIAHELGHVLFLDEEEPSGEPGVRLRERQTHLPEVDVEEERLCDLAAAEILMPTRQFSERLQRALGSPARLPETASLSPDFSARRRPRTPKAETILSLKRDFNTSLRATARRVVDVLRTEKIAAGLWEYNHSLNAFENRWLEGASSSARNRLGIGPEQPIYRALCEGKPFMGYRWFSLGGPIQDYLVEGFPLGRGRMLLVIIFRKRQRSPGHRQSAA